jgi:hypothetical protein
MSYGGGGRRVLVAEYGDREEPEALSRMIRKLRASEMPHGFSAGFCVDPGPANV